MGRLARLITTVISGTDWPNRKPGAGKYTTANPGVEIPITVTNTDTSAYIQFGDVDSVDLFVSSDIAGASGHTVVFSLVTRFPGTTTPLFYLQDAAGNTSWTLSDTAAGQRKMIHFGHWIPEVAVVIITNANAKTLTLKAATLRVAG